MTDALGRVLQLVAEGKLSAADAAPILAALDAKQQEPEASAGQRLPAASEAAGTGSGRPPRYARIEVREHGRRVVDLRIPISLGRFALSRVPGLSTQQISEVEEAVLSGTTGPILDVEDPDGDGVRIVLE